MQTPTPPAEYPPTGPMPPFGPELQRLLDYLTSSRLQEHLLALKIIFIIISIIFFVVIVYLLLTTEFLEWSFLRDLKNFLSRRAGRKKRLLRKWNRLKKNLERAKLEPQVKLALLEGLGLFERTLGKIGYPGESLREKIQKLPREDIKNFDQLLRAVDISEGVVRDPDYQLDKKQAAETLEVFEQTLRDLQAL